MRTCARSGSSVVSNAPVSRIIALTSRTTGSTTSIASMVRPDSAFREGVEVRERVLEPGANRLCHRGGMRAVEDAMVERGTHSHHLLDHDLAVARHRGLADLTERHEQRHP